MSLLDTIKAAQGVAPTVEPSKELANILRKPGNLMTEDEKRAALFHYATNPTEAERNAAVHSRPLPAFEVRDNREKRGIEVEFEVRPPEAVLEYMRFAKFRWGGRKLGYWWRGAWGDTASGIREQLEKAFEFSTLKE